MLAHVLHILAAVLAPPEARDAAVDPVADTEAPKKYDVDVDARLVAGARMIHEEPAVDADGAPLGAGVRKAELALRQARVGVDARYRDVLRVRVGERTRLQPVVFGEYVDSNMRYAESEAVRAGGGFNILWTKHLRIMPQVECVQPLAPVTSFNRFVVRQVYGLWMAVQL
jgi:hypothetical protein